MSELEEGQWYDISFRLYILGKSEKEITGIVEEAMQELCWTDVLVKVEAAEEGSVKVWIVCDDAGIVGVFSSLDKAEEYARRYKVRWDELACIVECSVDTETLPELSPAEQLLVAMGYTEKKEEK